MPNGATHTFTAALAIGGAALVTADKDQANAISKVAISGTAGALASKLPDLLEPALNPHHRQFFHSIVFAAGLGLAAYKLYKWEPQGKKEEWMRVLLLAGLSGYLLHLLMDGCTPRSLPMLGKISL